MLFKAAKLFLYASVFSIALVTTSTLFPFIVGKYAWFRGTVSLALVFFCLGLLFEADADQYLAQLKKLFRSSVVIAVTAFVAAYLLAGFFGVRPSFSFWSNFERGEGGMQILALYTFFMLLVTMFRDEKSWRKLMWCSIVTASLMILYGLLAGLNCGTAMEPRSCGIFGWGNIGPKFSDPNFRFQGSIGNAAYVSGHLIFILFFGLYLLLSSGRRFRSPQSMGLTALLGAFLFISIMSGTRGAFLGMMCGSLLALAYIAWYRRPWRKWLFAAGVIAVVVVTLLIQFKDSPFVQHIPGIGALRVFQISLTEQNLLSRFATWNIAFEAWKTRPVFGWGPENFLIAFDHHFPVAFFEPTRGFEAWYDRAHSTIFDYLAMTGAVGLATYLAVFVCLALLLLRRSEREAAKTSTRTMLLHAAFLGILVTYLVQGLVLFDVFALYLPLFMLFAFAVWQFEKPALPARQSPHPLKP